MFRKLGVFASQFDLSAVDAVVNILGVDCLDTVAHLVDVSLLRIRDGPDGEPRISLLETIRSFARHELARAHEDDETRLRHARWCGQVAGEMNALMSGSRQMEALGRLSRIEEDVRSALQWCLRPVSEVGQERANCGLDLVRQMTSYWYHLGYAAEGRAWLSRALEVAEATDGEETVDTLHGLALLQLQQGDVAPAAAGFGRALELTRRLGDVSKEARELNSLGVALRASGDIREAQRLIERSAELASTLGDKKRQSTAVSNLAMLLIDAENWSEALLASREAVALSATLDDTWGLVADQFNLTMPLLHVDGAEAAYAHLAGLTPRALSLEDAELNVEIVEMFALVVLELGHPELAARLLAAADGHRAEVLIPRTVPDQALIDRSLDSVRASPEWKSAYEQGRSLDIPAAVIQALSLAASSDMVNARAD